MKKDNVPPFKGRQKVVCVETDKDAMKNSSLKEKLINGNTYTVKECEFGNFGGWYVKVSGMRTEWCASSFQPYNRRKKIISSRG